MIRKFIKDSSIYGIAGILSRGISILLVPFYTRIFTTGDYGIIDILGVFGSIVSILFSFEITQAVARYYPATNNTIDKTKIASSSLIFTFISFSVFLLISQVFASRFSILILDNKQSIGVFRIWAVSEFFTALFYLFQNQLKWRLESVKYSIVSISYTIITLSLTILLVLVFNLKLYGVFTAKLAGAVFASAISFIFCRKDYKFIFNSKLLKEMLKFSVPLIPSTAGVFILNSGHRILVKALLSLSALGLFGVASRLTSLVSVIMSSFQGALTPLIMKNYREVNTPFQISKLFRYFSFFSILLFFSISIFSKEILIILTTPAYYDAYKLVPFLLLDKIFFAMYVFAPGLFIAKKTNMIAVINILSAIINISISFILLKTIGLIGAAIGTMVSSMAMFSLQMYFSQKNYFVPHKFKPILISLIVSSFLIYLVYKLDMPFSISTVIVKLVVLILMLFFLVLTGLVKIGELKKITMKSLVKND